MLHYAAKPSSRDTQPVRCFGCTTVELRKMVAWLKQRGIRTVALRSTGVYWIPVYKILGEAGLEVFLVNARDTKNLPGRKSDVHRPVFNSFICLCVVLEPNLQCRQERWELGERSTSRTMTSPLTQLQTPAYFTRWHV
jgi:hypothetical protein